VRGSNVLWSIGICRTRGVQKCLVMRENELEGLSEVEMSRVCLKRDGCLGVTTK